MEHKGLKSFGPIQVNGTQSIHRDQYGVSHMDDVFYVFPTEYNQDNVSSFDSPIIKTMCQHFAHFALHGKFGQFGQLPIWSIGHNWYPFDEKKQYYARFTTNFGGNQILQQATGYKSEYLSFWNSFIRQVLVPKIFDDSSFNDPKADYVSAQFLGTVQLHGVIRFGNHLLNVVNP